MTARGITRTVLVALVAAGAAAGPGGAADARPAVPAARSTVARAERAVRAVLRDRTLMSHREAYCTRVTKRRFECNWYARIGRTTCSGPARATRHTYAWSVRLWNESYSSDCYDPLVWSN